MLAGERVIGEHNGGGPVIDLDHHGDHDLIPGAINFAVNLHEEAPPSWLSEAVIAGAGRWASYPDHSGAQEALAVLRKVDREMVLPTSGAAEVFSLIALAIKAQHPVMVHPQFTEPEAALLRMGRPVQRVILDRASGFTLDPAMIDEKADLVIIGNPTNPTGVLHSADCIRALLRPGRVVVVDEAFADETGEAESLIAPQMPGLLVARSLTKIFSIAGIRAGYVVGDTRLVARLASQQTPWSVSWPAIEVMQATCSAQAQAFVAKVAAELPARRADLIARLEGIGLKPVASQSSFILVNTAAIYPNGSIYQALAARGIAVRRGETFPGLGPAWIRLAVRNPSDHQYLADALTDIAQGRGE